MKINSSFPEPQTCIESLRKQSSLVSENRQIVMVLNAIPDLAFIVNGKSEIVFANSVTKEWVHKNHEEDSCLGLRSGELVQCFISCSSYCGNHEACVTCGAKISVCKALEGSESEQEFVLYHEAGDALYYDVNASPLTLEDEVFAIVILKNKVHEKRRFELENIFFHNILKFAGNISGYAQLLKVAPSEHQNEYIDTICNSSNQLIQEIRSVRDLSAAEKNQLILENELIFSDDIIDELVIHFNTIGHSNFIYKKNLVSSINFYTDRKLVSRILKHMLYNAVEASDSGETITLGCELINNDLQFSVHNKSMIPKEYQPQIFQRTFSSKSHDRGLGTYSIKLLGEKYLKGKVSFFSSEEKGTTFYLNVPISTS